MKILRITILAAIMALLMIAPAGAALSPNILGGLNQGTSSGDFYTANSSTSLVHQRWYESSNDYWSRNGSSDYYANLGVGSSNPYSGRTANYLQATEVSTAWSGHVATAGPVVLSFDFQGNGYNEASSYVRVYGYTSPPTWGNYTTSGTTIGTFYFSELSPADPVTAWTGASKTFTASQGYAWYVVDVYGVTSQGSGHYLRVDNLSLRVTPIPPAVWLLGTGLLGLIGLRRKFSK